MEALAEIFILISSLLLHRRFITIMSDRPDILDIALMRKTITSWKKVSAALEETDTPVLNNIPDDIVSTDDIDNAIGALTSHITTVVENSSRKVPAKSDRKELPRDVIELIRDKNAALRRAGKYPTRENRSRARALQRRVKARIKEIKNDNWSDLMAEISPSHQAYWRLAKALKTEGAVPTPALKRPDNSIAFDDREKAECLADSIEHQCSENPPYDAEHVRRVEEEVRHRVSLPPKDGLDPITLDEVSKLIKGLKIRKSPEYISEGFKIKRKTVAVFFDVAKAFDRVWHAGLIHKLYQLELPDRLVIIIHHYISNRHFSFRLDNTYSSVRPIRAGVPQGSTLSPAVLRVRKRHSATVIRRPTRAIRR
ncbi:RNA-directed DNA polymerase from mobile element jockey [Eumeta japonica]|uniref:RNA-directed DNA polymerase from mobile element jockey n=1 Tax=Eumeta variegata TaxID=151549 RepID=A0A4C1ZZR2_EUMVA|nr:RNA-directed DNA polymerase from mobile element jockey [Eumeta japonica]